MRKITVLAAILVTLAIMASLPCMAADEGTKNVLKNAIVGAGTGAIAAGATGGKAGTGALIGAGTGAVGGALMDVLTQPSGSSKQERAEKTVAVQELYQAGYEKGYTDGFGAGYKQGLEAAKE